MTKKIRLNDKKVTLLGHESQHPIIFIKSHPASLHFEEDGPETWVHLRSCCTVQDACCCSPLSPGDRLTSRRCIYLPKIHQEAGREALIV